MSNHNTQRGGWSPLEHGTIEGHEVTAAFGTGRNVGQTLLADGHLTHEQFYAEPNGHDHYGSGNGPNNNGTSRGAYTGPDA